jgi:hypothetical protein
LFDGLDLSDVQEEGEEGDDYINDSEEEGGRRSRDVT